MASKVDRRYNTVQRDVVERPDQDDRGLIGNGVTLYVRQGMTPSGRACVVRSRRRGECDR